MTPSPTAPRTWWRHRRVNGEAGSPSSGEGAQASHRRAGRTDANEHLQHSEEWCHEVIRIYRHDWSPEQREKRSIGDLVASVPAAKKPGAPEGNQNAAKGDGNKRVNYPVEPERKTGANSPERIIAAHERTIRDLKIGIADRDAKIAKLARAR